MKIYGFIYLTTCLVNNKIYIGQSIHLKDSSYLGSGVALKEAIKKFGHKNFKRKILKICYSQEELDEQEELYIKKYNSTDKNIGYNILPGSANGFGKVNPAKIPEVNKKIQNAKRGKYGGENCFWFGKHLSDETKSKISKKASIRMSVDSNKPWLGKHHSDETKSKISKSRLGKSSSRKGVSLEISTKNKLSNIFSGYRWINNGVITKILYAGEKLPEGWRYGRILSRQS